MSEHGRDERGTAATDFGPDWQNAIDYGIDVTLLLENLERSPAERLARLQQSVEFHELLRSARPAGE